MPSKNTITFQGHLGKDAETFADGKICSLNIGSSESWKDKQGNKQESTTWMTVKIFGIKSEWAAKAKKGDLVEVIGKIKTDTYQDKEGKQRYTTFIEVPTFGTFINYSEWKRRSGSNPKQKVEHNEPDDDLPF